MIELPIDAALGEIVEALGRARAVVVVAAPGAGKTTRVPVGILRGGLGGEHPNVVMLQPRRVAARAAAARIAEENGWEIGREVGYQIRFEKRIGPATRLRVLTEGVLTRQLLSDPFLQGVGCVVLDEFHERSLQTDLAIAMLREMQQTVRPDLLIVIMSATLAADAAGTYLGDCPVIRVPGRMYPVEIAYRPHAAAPTAQRVATAVMEALAEQSGDILAFLPGAEEIRRAQRLLEEEPAARGVDVLPLHGSLPAAEQTLALRPSPRRKVILATNIAETSLTIDGVRVVIDSGLARIPAFDPRRGLDRLELQRISAASAEQRAGRAGRTGPGVCVRLWSAKEQAALKPFEAPEVRRVDLCAAVLDVHAWGKSDPRDFDWYEAPAEEALASAENLLRMLGALDESGVTALGRRLMRLPVHPRLGRLLCAAADAGCADAGAAMAAILSEKDFYEQENPAAGDSDLLLRLDALAAGRGERAALRQARAAQQHLETLARRLSAAAPMPPSRETLLKLPLLAYPDRVCRRRGSVGAGGMVGGGGVRLARESCVKRAELFLALDARHDPRSLSREAMVRIASAIETDWLVELFPAAVTRERTARFDEQRQRVVGVEVVRYRDLALSEAEGAAVSAAEAGSALAAALRPRAVEIFGADADAAQVMARVALLRRAMPEQAWPALDAARLGDVLEKLCAGKRSAAEVKGASLAAALEAELGYPLDRMLATEAPASLVAPTGNRIRLDYTAGDAPVLAVRLQEIFGWRDTPRVAGGRVAVVMQLLGPNFRPVQITSDLRSFWATTYFQVRKDLRVRYPKHSWPDDPLSAQPQAKGGRRK